MLKEAKNVILFVGDGMGVSTVTSSRIYNAQKSQSNYWEGRLSFDEFPHVGLCMVISNRNVFLLMIVFLMDHPLVLETGKYML